MFQNATQQMKSSQIGAFFLTKLLFLFLPNSSLFSQNDNFIKNYYPYINKAEISIIDSNFKEAYINYEKAFKNVQSPFVKDIHNALICSIKLRYKESIYIHLKQMANKGLPFENLIKNNYLKNYIQGNNLRKFYIQNYKDKKNNDLILKLETLLNSDQIIRKLPNVTKKQIWSQDSINAKNLLDLFSIYGFPNEEEIGYKGVLPNEDLYSLIIIHQNQLTGVFNFSEILFKNVLLGRILPNTALLLMFFQEKSDSLGFEYTSFKSILNFEIKKINKYRENWGIDNIENYSTKSKFSKINKNFEFNIKELNIYKN